jgi:mRNA-degrading endonuclease RelE of RelBE toxin-antitoxin system
MNVQIKVTKAFKRQAKPLLKKYASLSNDLMMLGDSITKNPAMGTKIMDGVHKIRLSIRSKAKGKSGGARVITYQSGMAALIGLAQQPSDNEYVVILLAIYDKSEISSISNAEIRHLIETIDIAP